MDLALQLTFSLLLTLFVKLSIVSFFFKKKKRQPAVVIALLINLITWIVGTIIWLKDPDVNQLYIRIATTIVEGVAYWFFFGRNWQKALLMTIATNLVGYFATLYHLPEDFFQKKNNMIR